ncbi:hypothetical protein D3C73_980400 [compost metagenome]
MNRRTQSIAKPAAKADSPLASEKISSVHSSTDLRPNLSARIPAAAAPAAIPTEFILVKSPIFSGPSSHSFASAATTNEIIPTSMASNIQLRPALSSSLRCLGFRSSVI